MKKKMKHLMTIATIIVFLIFAVASTDDKSNENNVENNVENNDEPTESFNGGGSAKIYEYEEDLGDGWTLFHAYKPSLSIDVCASKKCNWCNNVFYADDAELEEHPSDIWELAFVGASGNPERVDTVNKIIYSYWTVNCIYNYDNYCSRRCSEKY